MDKANIQKNIKSLNGLPEAEDVIELFDPEQALNDCLCDLTRDIQEPHPLISRNGNKIISPGNISAIKGKAKTCKSKLASDIAATFLREGNLGFNANPLPGLESVLICDTEQGLSHLYRAARQINLQTGFLPFDNNPLFNVISIKLLSENEGWQVFLAAIKRFSPGLVFLDGILDVAPAMNEERDCKLFIKKLYETATEYNTHIISILHENKGSRDMQGHLGHYLLKKSESVFALTLDKATKIITVENSEARDAPFEDFCFSINDNGLPELLDAPLKMTKAEINKYNRNIALKRCLALKRLGFNELKEAYALHACCAPRTAASHIKEAVQDGFIEIVDKTYILKKYIDETEE